MLRQLPAGVRIAAVLAMVSMVVACERGPGTSARPTETLDASGDLSPTPPGPPSASPSPSLSPSPSASPLASAIEPSAMIELGPPTFRLTSAEQGASPISVSVGWEHACAALSDGSVWCWGRNIEGQAGRGFTSSTVDLGPAPLVDGIVAVGVGLDHTCGITDAATVQCWGGNYWGTLGNGTGEPSLVPVDAVGLTDVRQLGSGYLQTCAVTGDGGVWCWGFEAAGVDRMDGIQVDVPTLLELPGPATLVAGGYHFGCALLADGTVWCWGGNNFGEFGVPGQTTNPTPTQVPGVAHAVDLDLGEWTSCAVLSDHTVTCWGYGEFGELGDGIQAVNVPPKRVAGIDDAVEVATGQDFACVRHIGGGVSCWGIGRVGEWGDIPDALPPILLATPVLGLAGVTGIDASYGNLCILVGSDELACWTYLPN